MIQIRRDQETNPFGISILNNGEEVLYLEAKTARASEEFIDEFLALVEDHTICSVEHIC